MPYFTSWDEFAKAVEQLYLASPNKSRFVIKYVHSKGSMVLKMTDDITCLMYRTDQLQDLKKLEKLNNTLLRLMINK